MVLREELILKAHCPFCGGTATITSLHYANTDGLYGYRLVCAGCGLTREKRPPCWTMGKKAEAMAKAKQDLVDWWMGRKDSDERVACKMMTAYKTMRRMDPHKPGLDIGDMEVLLGVSRGTIEPNLENAT